MTTSTIEKKRVFDFRMDAESWIMIALMIIAFAFVILPSSFGIASGEIGMLYYLGFGILLTFCLITMACIPVVIVCWFIKMIPDIDYAVWVASILTLGAVLGLIFS